MLFKKNRSESRLGRNLAQVGTIWAPKMDPKSIPKASQDEAKTTKKNEANKNRFRIGLGCDKGGGEKSRRVSYESGRGRKGRPVGKLPPAVREESERR